jgi:hypothetical protein
MLIVQLGNYLREIIYSHYGTWLPKYGFFGINNSSTLNPMFFSKWSNTNLEMLDLHIKNNDWVKYFDFRFKIRNHGELDFIKNYIFLRNRFVEKNIIQNYDNLVYWNNKKIIYRPFDSYITLNSYTFNVYEILYAKIWGWYLRDIWALNSNYFKSWYINQLVLEKQDIKHFGTIFKTLELRKIIQNFYLLIQFTIV